MNSIPPFFKTLLMTDTSQGGGSTITQQLAKTLYPRREVNSKIPGWSKVVMVWTKLKEWITAVKLERNYTKEEIVDMYLNSIFFGSSAYGIKAAALTFFDKQPSELTVEESAMLVGMVLALIIASFIPDTPSVINGIICCTLAVLTMLIDFIKNRETGNLKGALKSLDLETLLLLTGLFIVIGGITEAGIIDDFAGLIVKFGSGNLFLLYSIIVWGSVLISAFVDNIPYVATMLPVLTVVTRSMGVEPYLLYFGLLTGATLGGNLTPIGASANITAVGMLKREGHEVSFGDFMRIGVPFTLTAVFVGYVFIWTFWR